MHKGRAFSILVIYSQILQAKKEAILSKAKERLTRYEQWKSSGRKGGRRHVLGFGSRAPREVCLPLDSRRSSSQSTLRRSPNSSDYDSYFHRRAVSASSVVRRHCCIDINKLTQGTGTLSLTSLAPLPKSHVRCKNYLRLHLISGNIHNESFTLAEHSKIL